MSRIVVLMGVSGSGKTTVGQRLAERLGCPFYDGDDFHPAENVAKMANGIPLNDEDRHLWLAILRDMVEKQEGKWAVFACPALKKRYREQLCAGICSIFLVCLQGDFELIRQRLQARQNHYMKASLLQSQFDAFEPPTPSEALILNAVETVEQIVQKVLNTLNSLPLNGYS